MTLLTQTYFGNVFQSSELKAKLDNADLTCLHMELNPADCVKGRIHGHTTSGEKIGIVKERSWTLQDGDVFGLVTGQWLRVHVHRSESIVACFSPVDIGEKQWSPTKTALELVRLGHCLGNHHWPMKIEKNQITIQLTGNRDVFEALLAQMDLPGLVVTYESRSPEAESLASDQSLHFESHSHGSHHR